MAVSKKTKSAKRSGAVSKRPAARAASPSAKLLNDPAFALSGLKAAIEQITSGSQQMHEQSKPVALMAVHFLLVRQASDLLDDLNKALKATLDKLKTEYMPAAFEREDITTVTLKTGFRVTSSSTVRASISNEGKLRVWHVYDNGHIVNTHLDEGSARSEADASMSGKTVEMAEYAGKEAGHWWMRCNGLGDLIVETVNASTLSAAVRARMEEGKDMPEDLFNVALMPNTSITKVKS